MPILENSERTAFPHIYSPQTGSRRSAKPPCKQNPGADGFTGKFSKHKNIIIITY